MVLNELDFCGEWIRFGGATGKEKGTIMEGNMPERRIIGVLYADINKLWCI